MAMDLAPLFTRIEQLAPQFGRAEQDLLALVARGRSGDFKGSMQNARLVVETVLRHLVTVELKQTPGKAMLDELISKFRQSSNAGVIPIPVLAHMGTVQAWGNLSSHDHAANLNDQAMTLGAEELGTALNSLVAILAWYAGKYGPGAASAQAVMATPRPGAAAAATAGPTQAMPSPDARKKTNPLVMALALVIPIGGGLYAAWMVFTQGPSAVEVANAGVALNKFYLANREPPPGGPCRVSDARTLIKISHSPGSLALLGEVDIKHPEISYLRARALMEGNQDGEKELQEAMACQGFAAAHGLNAKRLGRENKTDEAAAELEKALELEPDWTAARFNLGLVELKRGNVAKGLEHMKAYTEAEPADGDGFMMLGTAYEAQARKAEAAGEATDDFKAKAKAAFCDAAKRGKKEARPRCEAP
jgi:hypothetical protein